MCCCGVWVHALCYAIDLKADPNPLFKCDACATKGAEAVDIAWQTCVSLQRQLTKAVFDATYGKGLVSSFRTFLADLDKEAIYMGREVGNRFFGGFCCSAVLSKDKELVAAFLEQKIASMEP